MGISYSAAKWIAPLGFVIDFAAQLYGIMATPNMKDINDANQSFFSPQPYFVAAFFFPQQLVQLGWLYRMWKLDPDKPNERMELDEMVYFVPYYTVGQLSLAGKFCRVLERLRADPLTAWMVSWNSSNLTLADAFVAINTLTQLYFMVALLRPMNTRSTSSVLTHIVSKALAGIGVLDLLHNSSVAFLKDKPATLLIKILTGVGFGLASAVSDWIFGGSLAYDLLALAAGQKGNWQTLLGIYALLAAAIVTARNIARPPYNHEYIAVEEGEAA